MLAAVPQSAPPLLGEALALGAAMSWAIAVILFKRSEAVTPQGLNLFKNVVAIALLGVTLPLLGQGLQWQRPALDWGRLALSGVLGIAVADTLFFMALRRLGAGRLAIVECVYAPCVVTLAVLVLGERPGPGFAAGAVLVVAGIAIVSTERMAIVAAGRELERRDRFLGTAFGILGVLSMAVGVMLAKPIVERDPLAEVTLVRLLAGVAGQAVWILLASDRSALRVFRPAPVWRTLLPAAVLGSYVSMLMWLGGFKWADASVAAVLNQMTAVFILVLGRVALGETLSVRRATGAAVAIAGAILVVALRARGGT